MRKSNTICPCGRRKYADAVSCDKCWNKGARYDSPKDEGYCKCGASKVSNASMCSACWDAQIAAYGD